MFYNYTVPTDFQNIMQLSQSRGTLSLFFFVQLAFWGKKGTSKIFYFGLEVQFDIGDTRVHNRILAHFETASRASVLVPGN